MTTHILGVDPGLTGAFALVHKTTRELIAYPIPTTKCKGKTNLNAPDMAAWLDCHRNLIGHAYVEQVSSRPRQAGQFQFGINTGVIHGMLWANIIPWTLVPPAQWKFHFQLKRLETESYRDKKNDARALATQLFPNHAKLFARVKDDGVAEASLIALYGLNQGER
jgi:crossover junction endodeoxyribonuclease RuvC